MSYDPQQSTPGEQTPQEEPILARTARRGPPLGSIESFTVLILIAAGVGLYVLLRRTAALGPHVEALGLLGLGLFALAWLAVILAVLVWMARHPALVRTAGSTGPLAVAAATLPAIGGFLLLGTLNPLGMWLREHEMAGVVLYVLGFALLSGLALLPTYAQAILGGWAFGVKVGLPAALLGFVGGSLIMYTIVRIASGERIVDAIDASPKWRTVRMALVGGSHGEGFWRTTGTVALVRLPPNSPFALTNLVLASVRTPVGPFALGTLVGMAPRTALAVAVASVIEGEFNSEAIEATRPGWFAPVAIGVTLVVFFVLYRIGKRAIEKVAAQGEVVDAEHAGGD